MIYPRRCPLCGEIVKNKGCLACKECYETAPFIKEPRCKCCGKAILKWEQEYCEDCTRKQHHFSYGFSLWSYNAQMKQSIAYFKYHHRREYGDFYGKEFAKRYGTHIKELEIDALIPVPIHWTRHIQRGYNQAQVIAQVIGKELNLPVVEDLLIRNRKTVAQKQLGSRERAKNLESAFKISQRWINKQETLKKILLVDDIYTTGSTLDACAKVLKQVDIAEVYFGVLCVGIGF